MRNILVKTLMFGIGISACLTSCATMVNGPTQDVPIATSPIGARVMIDGVDYGDTPVVATLTRNRPHSVTLIKNGYEDRTVFLNQSVSGAVAGNILFGGAIGIAADAGSGAMYKLSPGRINVPLRPENSAGREVYYQSPPYRQGVPARQGMRHR